MTSASAQDAETSNDLPTPAPARPRRFVDVTDAVAGVKGWMTPGQAKLLWRSARVLDPGQRIVEIGSFQGRSTIVLAAAAPSGTEVVAIDPHAGNDRGPNEIEGYEDEAEGDHQIFKSNLAAAGVSDRVTHVRQFSDAALEEVEGPIDLLYIDGAHRFGPARDDIVAWGARVTPGGTMLIHDSFNAVGVTLAQAAVLFTSGEFRYVGRSESMAEYRKERLGPLRRVTNLGRQLAQLGYFAWCQLVKVLITLKLGRLTKFIGNPSGEWPY
ncbi:MAG: class I SAM-dependent methyltransferase [Microthrixaceae bacterium]